MWIGDYNRGVELAQDHTNFDALVAAALMRADSFNASLLRSSFPDLCAEVQRRYDAPGGALTLEEWIAAHGDPDEGTRLYLVGRFAP